MRRGCFPFISFIALVSATGAHAQSGAPLTNERVRPAALQIPAPDNAAHPLPPDQLRAQSPWTLSLAGNWRFRLTYGQIRDGRFALSDAKLGDLRVSSSQGGNAAVNAFDGDPATRWCASGGNFPQWLQVRLDAARQVTGVEIAWEHGDAHYKCRIEGGSDGVHWRTLLDRSTDKGIGDGMLALPASSAPVKYLRLVMPGADSGSWASIRELKIHYRKGDQEVVWRPAPPPRAIPAHANDFVAPGFDDRKWSNLPIPSNWEMAGYSIPTYNTVDDSVGLYRRWIDAPKAWSGRRILWRFDGALDGTEVFVNGKRAGYHESGYTAFDVDVTGLLKPGQRNLLAVRVCKSTPSVECDTGDYQSMGGIYRDTRLIAVPQTHIGDLTVRTPLSADYRDATLHVDTVVKGTPGESVAVTGYITDAATLRRLQVSFGQRAFLGRDGKAALALEVPVKSPKLWSAEKPNLYYVTLVLKRAGKPVERVEQRFGFRQVEIKDRVVLWNGKPIKCTGICRHDFWADKGFALTDTEWKKDLTMMKETNINAIRTSHYNHAARFLELCDERGFYILDEVPFCWVDNRVSDPKFAPPLLQRAAETVARDKNRACVLAWSLGNENPVGIDTQKVHDLVERLDPTRPSFASQSSPSDVKGQKLFDSHYPSPEWLQRYIEKDSGIAPEVITEHPHTFYSRETQTYDPGASDTWSEGMIATWDLLWRSPTILGSFIWEWQNQGVADHFPDRITDFYFGPDHMRQENNKGIVDAYRHPKAEQWIVKMVYSPVQLVSRKVRVEGGSYVVPLINRYTFTNLNELAVHWTAFKNQSVVGRGVARINGAPGAHVNANIPASASAGATALELRFDRADGSNVTVARLDTPETVLPSAPAALAGGSLFVHDDATVLAVESSSQRLVFDKTTGTIRRWTVGGQDRLVRGLSVNLGEAKTASGDNYYRAKQPPVTDGATVEAKTDSNGNVVVTTRSTVRPKAGSTDALGVLVVEYTVRPSNEIGVRWRLDWTAADTNLWEIGLSLPLPAGITHQSWLRDSYFAAYPAGHIGAPTGVCGPNDVAFRAAKRSLRYLTLTGKGGAGVAVIAGDGPLVGRAKASPTGTILYASSEMAAAGPDDLSRSWFRAHDIHATKTKPLTGTFTLRAIGK